jgi:hypothetical protein
VGTHDHPSIKDRANSELFLKKEKHQDSCEKSIADKRTSVKSVAPRAATMTPALGKESDRADKKCETTGMAVRKTRT